MKNRSFPAWRDITITRGNITTSVALAMRILLTCVCTNPPHSYDYTALLETTRCRGARSNSEFVYTRALNWANITPRCLTKGYDNTKDTLRIHLLEFRPCVFCVKYGCRFHGASISETREFTMLSNFRKFVILIFLHFFFLPSVG